MSQGLLATEKEILERGKDYEDLVHCSGWQRIVRFLENRADRALAELRDSKFAAAEIVRARLIAWLNWEEMLDQTQAEVASGMDDRKEMTREILESQQKGFAGEPEDAVPE